MRNRNRSRNGFKIWELGSIFQLCMMMMKRMTCMFLHNMMNTLSKIEMFPLVLSCLSFVQPLVVSNLFLIVQRLPCKNI